jgi:hypothetical protein
MNNYYGNNLSYFCCFIIVIYLVSLVLNQLAKQGVFPNSTAYWISWIAIICLVGSAFGMFVVPIPLILP